MPSAANAKSEKAASSEATDNSPVRQIITLIEHKIRNLEKRKSKLTSYRDLQKAGKELNSDQKVAVAKYDEVAQTLEFAREISKQVATISTAAEREAKKQAKKEAWVRYAAETNKIREVLLILDCLMQMGNNEARVDFLSGSNGAAQLTEEDLKILDDLYPEVTPKHEVNEEGQSGFHVQVTKAAEHLYAVIDGKPKEVIGTTYARIKEIVSTIHECGYFDKTVNSVAVESEENCIPTCEEAQEVVENEPEGEPVPTYPPAGALPVPPAPAVSTPAYPLRPLPPITLQEVEHAYFSQQYPQQRPIAEVIGSQNFFFLQESEIDSPIGTPQPPPITNQPSPPGPIPTQTFTNQHFVQIPGTRVPDSAAMPLPPQPHFAPHPEHPAYPPTPAGVPMPGPMPQPHPPHPLAAQPPAHPAGQPGVPQPSQTQAQQQPHPQLQPQSQVVQLERQPVNQHEERRPATPVEERNDDEWKESRSPEREDGERKAQGQGDGQNRFRRYGRGTGRGAPNGHRGRGTFSSRQGGEGYRGRHGGEYQSRPNKEGYQNRQYDGYQNRHGKDGYHNRGGDDGYYGNGDTADSHQHNENGGRDRYNDNNQSYQGGFKGRGGGPRGGARGAPRPPRSQHYNRKPENVE
ncbi:LOW QUALITY PROTEIN: caprin family member [Aphomia sociella]